MTESEIKAGLVDVAVRLQEWLAEAPSDPDMQASPEPSPPQLVFIKKGAGIVRDFFRALAAAADFVGRDAYYQSSVRAVSPAVTRAMFDKCLHVGLYPNEASDTEVIQLSREFTGAAMAHAKKN